MSKDNFEPFKKACGKDVNMTSGPVIVHIYPDALTEAERDFQMDTREKIKSFFADVDEKNIHFYKEDKLEKVIFGIPKGTPFDVFHFDFKSPKDGYLAVLNWKEKKMWLLKSCKKNESSVFANNAFSELESLKKDKQ